MFLTEKAKMSYFLCLIVRRKLNKMQQAKIINIFYELEVFFAKVCSLNLFHKKDQNKVGLGISFIENAEMRYAWGSNLLKRSKK